MTREGTSVLGEADSTRRATAALNLPRCTAIVRKYNQVVDYTT